MDDIPARVAVLEQIARSTDASLNEIRTDIRELRADNRWLIKLAITGFTTLAGLMLAGFLGLLGVMAHGFHWL